MEARARLEEAENGKLCEACVTGAQAESVEIKRAELYCIECKMRLCQSCQSNHSNANPTHTCVRIKNDLSPAAGETVVKLTDLTCDKHVGEKMRLFCNDCREVICLACMVDVHQQHSWTDVNKVDKELRQLMTEEDTENLTRHAEGCQESVNRMEGMRSEVNDVVADIESAVRKQAEQLKSLIEAERETLLQKLYTGHRWRLGKIESAMDELQLHISLVEFLRRYADELYRRGMDIDVAQQNQSVRRNAAQLLQFDPEGALDSLNKFRITYNPSSTVEEWSEVNALGDLEILMNEG